MIYVFFEHAGCSAERQPNLLLRTGRKYDWKKVKEAVELLYPNVVVNKSYQNRNYMVVAEDEKLTRHITI